VPEQYYHVYSRGSNKQLIYYDDDDYSFFLSLFKRYISSTTQRSKSRVAYPNYFGKVELNAYCLMPNHFHLLVYQCAEDGLKKLMQSALTSYSMYFNQKYAHLGPVFQSRYLASIIDKQSYLEHITRYIHLNPKDWKTYPYSSLQYYAGSKTAEWINTRVIMEMFKDYGAYYTFLEDYEDHKAMLNELKYELADQIIEKY
jgi:putative transposase